MSHRSLKALAAGAVLVLAACSSGGGSASSGASSQPSAAGPQTCHETTDPGAVAVSIVDFAFRPADITAKAGQVIAFTDIGSASHTATLDNGHCATSTLGAGKSDGLVFTLTGTYKFHCAIHSSMTGTIVIS